MSYVDALGLNYRMSEMQAALGRQQLSRIEDILEIRQRNYARLKSLLSELSDIFIIDTDNQASSNIHYCLSIVLQGDLRQRRQEIVANLNAAGVGTSIYYPHPVPRLAYYRQKYGYNSEAYPNAAAISDYSIALPVGPHVSSDDLDYIGEVVKKTLTKVQT